MTPRLPPPSPPRELHVSTPDLGRAVILRAGTSDEQVWADTFTGRYHLPPERMPTPTTVLDLGANIGLTAAHYRKLWPSAEVVAVEMDAQNAAVAERNAHGVKVRALAVSDRDGVTYYDDSGRSTDAFAVRDNGKCMVMGQTLRKIILRAFGAAGVDFVKMDVEGMEWRLFAKADWAPLVRNLLVELHAVPGSYPEAPSIGDALIEKAKRMLKGAGFEADRHAVHPQAVFACSR